MTAPATQSAYQPDYASQAEQMCRLGGCDSDLAAAFGVDEDTIADWREVFPDFDLAIARGAAAADAAVTAALLRRACGFEQRLVKWLREDGQLVAKTYSREVPPDRIACTFWLKNRRPDLWQDGRGGRRPVRADVDDGGDIYDGRVKAIANDATQSARLLQEMAEKADKKMRSRASTAAGAVEEAGALARAARDAQARVDATWAAVDARDAVAAALERPNLGPPSAGERDAVAAAFEWPPGTGHAPTPRRRSDEEILARRAAARQAAERMVDVQAIANDIELQGHPADRPTPPATTPRR